MRSRSISTDAVRGLSESSYKRQEHTKEIKRFPNGNVASSLGLVEGY
jgi:hypothetical protein